MYTIFELLFIGGVLIVGLAAVWLVARVLRRKGRMAAPLMMVVLGVSIACVPVVYTRFISQVDLGEREKIVDGERHLTLTGWDRDSYEFLRLKTDTVVLQMANPDVTDPILAYLSGMELLRELDLDNTQITDDGLKALETLPALEMLRLGGTGITDEGFRSSVMQLPKLKRLNLRDTQVSDDAIEAWKQSGQGRRALK